MQQSRPTEQWVTGTHLKPGRSSLWGRRWPGFLAEAELSGKAPSIKTPAGNPTRENAFQAEGKNSVI